MCVTHADRDPLLDEMIALGEQKKVLTLQLSRLGVFATQFMANQPEDGSGGKHKVASRTPPGRSRGSTEFKAVDFAFKKVGFWCA